MTGSRHPDGADSTESIGATGVGADALSRVMADLRATYGDATDGIVRPLGRPVGHRDETVWFETAGGSRFGIVLYRDDAEPYATSAMSAGDPTSVAERVAALVADQVQQEVVQSLPAAGRPAVWPGCPHHPASHPLSVDLHHGTATWVCPRGGASVAAVGRLPRSWTNVT